MATMRIKHRLALIFLSGIAAGCSSSSPPPGALERGPHQGFLRPLPDGSGFAEIVVEPITKSSPKAPRSQLSVYFLSRDRTSSLNPVPKDVNIGIIWSDSTPRQTLILSSKPAPDDPAGAARFVSVPGDYDGAVSGTMTLKLGERTISAAF
jgi:hypothetical protein